MLTCGSLLKCTHTAEDGNSARPERIGNVLMSTSIVLKLLKESKNSGGGGELEAKQVMYIKYSEVCKESNCEKENQHRTCSVVWH